MAQFIDADLVWGRGQMELGLHGAFKGKLKQHLKIQKILKVT
jgi:hypothetical protein